MSAKLIDGTLLSQQMRADVAKRAAILTAAGKQPGLAVILVGEDPASHVYVRNKVKACADTGIHSVFEKYESDLSEQALLERIAKLNEDPTIHGILVQMPLPKHIDPNRVIAAISTRKDVDGFSVMSAGELMSGLPGFRPATPYGCMKMIESTGTSLRGKHAVVIGRSNSEKSVAAIATRTGRTPDEVAYDYIIEENQYLYFPVVNYVAGDHEPIREMLSDPACLLGLSDGGAHCTSIVDSGLPSFMLAHWGRDRRRGPRLPLEHLVKRQTSETADFFSLSDRGRLVPGLRADVNIID